MKKLTALLLSAMLASSVTYIILSDHFTGAFPWQTIHREGEILTKIPSAVLGEDRELIIRLPHHYSQTETYPVMYVLDGGSEDKQIADKLEVLSAIGYTRPVIVVGIPNMSATDRQQNLTPPFMRIDVDEPESPLGQGDRFLKFIKTELIPFIEKTTRQMAID
jgi:predicted alpha/beta superfamily hydrolase